MLQRFSTSISLLWNNFGLLSAIILTVWLPGNLLLDFLIYKIPEASLAFQFKIPMLIEGVFGPIYIGALVYALFKIKKGVPVTYKEAISIGLKKWGSLFGARFVAGIYIMVGFVALIVPGIILAARYALVDSAVILESKGPTGAMTRSKELTMNKKMEIFISAILFFISFFIFSFIIYLPLGFFDSVYLLPIEVLLDCLVDILYSVLQIVIFLFYWEATQETNNNQVEQIDNSFEPAI